MKFWQAGLTLLSLMSAADASGITVGPIPLQPYTQYSFTTTATGLDTIIIGLRDDGGFDDLDNVAVTGTAGTNLLANGSFETGDFTGWSHFGNFASFNTSVATSASNAQDGSSFVVFGASVIPAFIYQGFTDTPGETLTYSAWVRGFGGQPSVFCMMNELEGTSCTIQRVPEPLSLALFGVGLAGLGVRRRRR